MTERTYDVYIVGLGGQGILTIGDLLAHAALMKGLKVNFYPTKGMSQRGGFVQGQLRIGREAVGASLPPQGADLVVAMERSEALKGIRFAKEGTDFLLYDYIWPTTAVVMGKAHYPEMSEVTEAIKASRANLICLSDASLPQYNGVPVRANMFILGALLKRTRLKDIISYDDVVSAMSELWPKGADANLTALKAGFEAKVETVTA